jgi:hypothetical protein
MVARQLLQLEKSALSDAIALGYQIDQPSILEPMTAAF